MKTRATKAGDQSEDLRQATFAVDRALDRLRRAREVDDLDERRPQIEMALRELAIATGSVSRALEVY